MTWPKIRMTTLANVCLLVCVTCLQKPFLNKKSTSLQASEVNSRHDSVEGKSQITELHYAVQWCSSVIAVQCTMQFSDCSDNLTHLFSKPSVRRRWPQVFRGMFSSVSWPRISEDQPGFSQRKILRLVRHRDPVVRERELLLTKGWSNCDHLEKEAARLNVATEWKLCGYRLGHQNQSWINYIKSVQL